MTHFSENPGMVRVDYFKVGGKWYMTEAHDMSEFYNEPSIFDAVRKTLQRDGRWLPHFIIVVLEPYHQNAYPVMFVPGAQGHESTFEEMRERIGSPLSGEDSALVTGMRAAVTEVHQRASWCPSCKANNHAHVIPGHCPRCDCPVRVNFGVTPRE